MDEKSHSIMRHKYFLISDGSGGDIWSLAILNGTSWTHVLNFLGGLSNMPSTQILSLSAKSGTDAQKLVPGRMSELMGHSGCRSGQCDHPFSCDLLYLSGVQHSGHSCLQPSLLTSSFLLVNSGVVASKLPWPFKDLPSRSQFGSQSSTCLARVAIHDLWMILEAEINSWPMFIFKGTEGISTEWKQNLCLLFWGAKPTFSFIKVLWLKALNDLHFLCSLTGDEGSVVGAMGRALGSSPAAATCDDLKQIHWKTFSTLVSSSLKGAYWARLSLRSILIPKPYIWN